MCLQVVFTVDRPCQLLGVGLCGTQGAFTVELDVFEVRTNVALFLTSSGCVVMLAAVVVTATTVQLLPLTLGDRHKLHLLCMHTAMDEQTDDHLTADLSVTCHCLLT
jgi:hypothetical protein